MDCACRPTNDVASSTATGASRTNTTGTGIASGRNTASNTNPTISTRHVTTSVYAPLAQRAFDERFLLLVVAVVRARRGCGGERAADVRQLLRGREQ
jgi:hypothetical protein